MWNKVVKMRSKRRTLINRLLPLEKGREGTGQFFKCVFSSSSLAPTTFLFQMWHWTLATFFSFLPLSALQQLDGFIRIFLETGLDPLLVLYFMMRLLYPPFHPLASSTLNLLRSVVDSRRRRRRRRRRWDSPFPTLQWDVHMCFESFNTHRRLLVMGHHPIQYNNNKKREGNEKKRAGNCAFYCYSFLSIDKIVVDVRVSSNCETSVISN